MFSPIIWSFLGFFFLSSGWTKLRAPGAFLEIVRSYPFASRIDPRPLSRAIPALEAVIGLAFLSLREGPVLVAAGGALVFLALATAALMTRLARGETRFRCGCGGDLTEAHGAIGMVIRNALLIAAVVTGITNLLNPWSDMTMVMQAYLTGAGLVLSLASIEAAARTWRFAGEWKAPG